MRSVSTSQRVEHWVDADLTPQTGEHDLGATERLPGGLLRPQPLRDPDHRAHKAALAEALFGAPRETVRIGRFRVLERLGEGGMGVVYAGHDDELDRRVAIKLLHVDGELAQARTRLLREAQALARLSHPNVVQLFEVGEHDGRLFVAMEHVRGQTLHTWLHAGPRAWREVLDVFLAAGRGLAAAHEVGLVHRDFKPGNVMLGDDGRVRVLDFGLARAQAAIDGPRAPMLPAAGDGAAISVLASPLTMTGSVVGTPAYMAPEQLHTQRSDPRSDQFSFCVALFEALYGARPHVGATHGEILAAIERGQIRRPPAGTRVPSWLHTIVVRGLASDPARRWPSMPALLAELTRDRHARRRRWTLAAVIAGLGAVPLGLGLAAGLEHYEHGARKAACEARSAPIAALWDFGARLDTFARLGPSPSPRAIEWAADTALNLSWGVERMREDRVDACMRDPDGYVHPQFLKERHEREDRCFTEAHDRLRTSIAVARQLDPETTAPFDESDSMALRHCLEAAELPGGGSSYPEDPALRERWLAIHGEVVRAELEVESGRPLAAEALLVPVVAEARALRAVDLGVDAIRTLMRAHFAAGHRRAGLALFEVGLAFAGDRLLARPNRDWYDSSPLELALGGVGGKPRLAAALLYGKGRGSDISLRETEGLGGLLERVVSPYWRKDWPTLDGRMARSSLPALLASAQLLVGVGDHERAEDYARTGLAIVGLHDRVPGLTVDLLLVLAAAEQGLGRLPRAAQALQQALALATATDADPVARLRLPQLRLALADLALARGELDVATKELTAAEALAGQAEADDDRFVPALTLLLARLHAARGDHEGATQRTLQARDALASSHGVARRMLVAAELEAGRQALIHGEPERAAEALTTALRHNEALLGPEHVSHAEILAELARAQRTHGKPALADESLARARALITDRVVDPTLRAAVTG